MLLDPLGNHSNRGYLEGVRIHAFLRDSTLDSIMQAFCASFLQAQAIVHLATIVLALMSPDILREAASIFRIVSTFSGNIASPVKTLVLIRASPKGRMDPHRRSSIVSQWISNLEPSFRLKHLEHLLKSVLDRVSRVSHIVNDHVEEYLGVIELFLQLFYLVHTSCMNPRTFLDCEKSATLSQSLSLPPLAAA